MAVHKLSPGEPRSVEKPTRQRGSHAIGRPKGSGSQRVYDNVRERILRLEWSPGKNIDEMALVEEFGVSRTPIREALIRLSSEGLVVIQPNRGAQVAPMNIDEVREFFEMLDLCQRAATRWAAKRRTNDQLIKMQIHCDAFMDAVERGDSLSQSENNALFHMAIADACGNVHMRDTYNSLLTKGMRLSHLSLTQSKELSPREDDFYDWMLDEHQQMVDAIRRGDEALSESLAAAHTVKFRQNVFEFIGFSASRDISV